MSDRDANGPALILIAHGSRRAEANEAHVELCRAVSTRIARMVSPAFLELAAPGIAAAIDQAVEARGARRVVLLPYFLHPGNHTREDIPAIVAEARVRHGGVQIDQLDHVGASPAVVGLIAELLAVS